MRDWHARKAPNGLVVVLRALEPPPPPPNPRPPLKLPRLDAEPPKPERCPENFLGKTATGCKQDCPCNKPLRLLSHRIREDFRISKYIPDEGLSTLNPRPQTYPRRTSREGGEGLGGPGRARAQRIFAGPREGGERLRPRRLLLLLLLRGAKKPSLIGSSLSTTKDGSGMDMEHRSTGCEEIC